MKFTAIAKAIFVLGILTTSVMITEKINRLMQKESMKK